MPHPLKPCRATFLGIPRSRLAHLTASAKQAQRLTVWHVLVQLDLKEHISLASFPAEQVESLQQQQYQKMQRSVSGTKAGRLCRCCFCSAGCCCGWAQAVAVRCCCCCLLVLLLLGRFTPHTLMTRLLSSCGIVGSLQISMSLLAPAGSSLNSMSSPRSITCMLSATHVQRKWYCLHACMPVCVCCDGRSRGVHACMCVETPVPGWRCERRSRTAAG